MWMSESRHRQWVAAAAIGAIGAPVTFSFLFVVWLPVTETTPAMRSLPVLIMVAMPVGLLAGAVARGIGGLVALWLGALASTIAVAVTFVSASQNSAPGWAAFGTLLAVLFFPQAVLPGYVLARVVDRAVTGRSRAMSGRLLALWLIPSAVLFSVIGLIGVMSGAALRSSRESSCPPLASNIALSGRIVFVGSNALCVADLQTHSVRIAYGSPTDVDETLSSPRWSADGKTIAVISKRRPVGASETSAIALIRLDGGSPTQIHTPADAGNVSSLDWAPDGTRLVAALDRPGCGACAQLYVVTVADGTWQLIPLAQDVRDLAFPAWSPVGDRILVGAARDDRALYGAASLLVVDIRGGTLASIATDADFLAPASWSPDGSRIAFGRKVERAVDVFIARADGTNVERRTTTDDAATYPVSTNHPVWSPEGDALAVSVDASDGRPPSLSIVPVSGGPPTKLIDGAADFDWTP
jgi:hypothetical protein